MPQSGNHKYQGEGVSQNTEHEGELGETTEDALRWHFRGVHALFSQPKGSQENTMDPKHRKETVCDSLP